MDLEIYNPCDRRSSPVQETLDNGDDKSDFLYFYSFLDPEELERWKVAEIARSIVKQLLVQC